MCVGSFFKIPDPKPMQAPPPITPRVEVDTELPTAKPTVDPKDAKTVKYGAGKKAASGIGGRKTGANQLRIDINRGQDTGSTTGGLNV